MKRFIVITAFLLTASGICLADYDYYSKHDPQNCYEALEWDKELLQEAAVLGREHADISIESLKPGDNAPTFNKKQAYKIKQSMWNDEYRLMKEYKERLCPKK